MNFTADRINSICEKLYEMKTNVLYSVDDFKYCKTEYKTSNKLPTIEQMSDFDSTQTIGGYDEHLKNQSPEISTYI